MRSLRLLWIAPLVVALLPAGRALAGPQLSVEQQRAKLIQHRMTYLDFAMCREKYWGDQDGFETCAA